LTKKTFNGIINAISKGEIIMNKDNKTVFEHFFKNIRWERVAKEDGKIFLVLYFENGDQLELELVNGITLEQFYEKLQEEFYKYIVRKINIAMLENNSNRVELSDSTALVVSNQGFVVDGETLTYQEILLNLKAGLEEFLDKLMNEMKENNIVDGKYVEIEDDKIKITNMKKAKFRKIATKAGIFICGAVTGIALLAGSGKLSRNNPYDNKTVVDVTIEDNTINDDQVKEEQKVAPVTNTEVVVENVAEDAIKYVTYDEFVNTTNEFAAMLKKNGIENVSPVAINSMQFLANIQNIDSETMQKFIENNMIREDAVKIIEDTYELFDVVMNQAIAGKVIDLSSLSHETAGREIIKYTYDFINEMRSKDNAGRKESLLDFYAFVNNNNLDTKTTFPYLRSEISIGTDYVMSLYNYLIMIYSTPIEEAKDILTVLNDIYSSTANVEMYISNCLEKDKTNVKTR